jgi:hypothetical protein
MASPLMQHPTAFADRRLLLRVPRRNGPDKAHSMSRYHIDLANTDDDDALRTVLAATPMEGMISIGFHREPSYFRAAVVDGRFRQVAVVRDEASKGVVGLGCRSVCTRYVNGQPVPIGYLSNLRVLPEHRQRGLVARAYAMLHEMHEDKRTPLYLTTIAHDNHTAIKVLTSGRIGLPTYHFVGCYHTMTFSLTRRRKMGSNCAGLGIRPAREDDKDVILEFLQTVGPKRQFFPCYETKDLFTSDGLLSGLRPEDLLLAFRGRRLVGTLAGWDQRAFRQTVVHGYGRPLSWLRPLYNIWTRCRGIPQLPQPGRPLRCLMGAIPLIVDDDPGVFQSLLEALLWDRSGRQWECLFVGMHQSDPLLPTLQNWPAVRYTTHVYLACWEDGENLRQSLDARPLYLELGSL